VQPHRFRQGRWRDVCPSPASPEPMKRGRAGINGAGGPRRSPGAAGGCSALLSGVFPPLARHGAADRHLGAGRGRAGSIPGPARCGRRRVKVLFADPFYSNGPNDQGIGWNVLSSLQRVGIGFGFAALVGIPLGFIIGRFAFMNRCSIPIIAAAPGVAAGLAADRPAGVQEADPARPGPSSSARSGR
jgi:nitrate/nitrite transport system permease protein